MKRNQRAEDQGSSSVANPKLVWVPRTVHDMERTKLAGPAQKGFSDPHPMEMTHLPREDAENVVWTTVCKTTKKP